MEKEALRKPLEMAILSKATYIQKNKQKEYINNQKVFKNNPVMQIHRVDNKGMSASIFIFRKCIVVGFRGTANIKGILYSLDIRTKNNIHKGFLNATECVIHEIINILESIEIDNKEIYITGHSLGGAMAVIATDQYMQKYSQHNYSLSMKSINKNRAGLRPGHYQINENEIEYNPKPPGFLKVLSKFTIKLMKGIKYHRIESVIKGIEKYYY